MQALARDVIRKVEQTVYALADEIEATEAQKRRIDGAMFELFSILDLDRPVDVESRGDASV